MKTFAIISLAALSLVIYSGCDSSKETKSGKMDHSKMQMNKSTEVPAPAVADESELKEQTICPVMGSAINKDLYVDKDGKRIYYCCAGCKEPLEKEFEKYEAKLKEMGQKPEKL